MWCLYFRTSLHFFSGAYHGTSFLCVSSYLYTPLDPASHMAQDRVFWNCNTKMVKAPGCSWAIYPTGGMGAFMPTLPCQTVLLLWCPGPLPLARCLAGRPMPASQVVARRRRRAPPRSNNDNTPTHSRLPLRATSCERAMDRKPSKIGTTDQ